MVVFFTKFKSSLKRAISGSEDKIKQHIEFDLYPLFLFNSMYLVPMIQFHVHGNAMLPYVTHALCVC